MSRTIIIIVLVILIVFSWIELFILFKEGTELRDELSQINGKLQSLEEENSGLKAQIEYYLDPVNLEKELKSKYNYRLPDEKMIIVVP